MEIRLCDFCHGLLAKESARTTKSHFDGNETAKRAFVRSLEIIGEATKKVPSDLKQRHPHIDWRGMTGMRDKLIHDYFGVDYDIVWDVVTNKISELDAAVRQIIESEYPDAE